MRLPRTWSMSGLDNSGFCTAPGEVKFYRKTITQPHIHRRMAMKSGNQDKAEGKMHQVKGKVKEVIGKTVDKRDLESEGIVENVDGKLQEKIGEAKKTLGK
jgi:uncharacterized protein YjbJ (UPF0337 family)